MHLHLWQGTVGISGTPLSLLMSYLYGQTQCVQIEGIISEYVKLVCGVPQGSVLGPLNFCFCMYPLGSISRHHCINYHIYADDTQVYITFDLSDPSIAIEKLNLCISDIRNWMIKSKLKINDSKTEYLVLTSSFFKQVLPSYSTSTISSSCRHGCMLYRSDSRGTGVPAIEQMAPCYFKLQIAECLSIQSAKTEARKQGRPSVELEVKKRRGSAFPLPSKAIRMDANDYWSYVLNYREMQISGCKGRSHVICSKCCNSDI